MVTSATQSRGYCSWIPLVTPAVQQDSCGLDEDLLWSRACKVHLVAIALIVLSVVYLTPALALCAIPFTLIPLLDQYIATKAVDVKAVNEFSHGHPSPSATEWIRRSPNAVRLLIERDKNLNQSVNESDWGGKRLIQNLDRPWSQNEEVLYKTLLRNGYKLTNDDLAKMVRNKNTTLLEFVLKNKIVTPAKDGEASMAMWMNVGTTKAAELLRDHGFDVNAKNFEGDTALVHVIKENERNKHADTPDFLVRTLLEFGADPHIGSPKWEGRGRPGNRSAFDINRDPAIEKILQPYQK